MVTRESLKFIAVFLAFCTSFAFPLITSIALETLDWSVTKTSFVIGCITLFSGLFQPYLGIQLDKGAIGNSFFIIGFLYCLGTIFLAFAKTNPILFIPGMILLNLSIVSLFTVQKNAILANLRGADLAAMTNKYYRMFFSSSLVANLLAFFFFNDYSHFLLITDGLVTVISLIILYYCRSSDEVPSLQNDIGVTGLVSQNVPSWVVLLILVSLSFSNSYLYPLKLRSLTEEVIKFSALLNIFGTVSYLVGSKFYSFIAERVQDTFGLMLSGILMIVSSAFVLSSTTAYGVLVWSVLFIFGQVILFPCMYTKIYSKFSKNDSGKASGIVVALKSAGSFINPLVSSLFFL